MKLHYFTFDISGVLLLHDVIIKKNGGCHGISQQGKNSLISALQRPFAGTADGELFYPTRFEQAAVLLSGLIKSHPFIDGNKRTAYFITVLFLFKHKYFWKMRLTAPEVEADFLEKIARDYWTIRQLAIIIRLTCQKLRINS